MEIKLSFSGHNPPASLWHLSPTYLEKPDTWQEIKDIIDNALAQNQNTPCTRIIESILANIEEWETNKRRVNKNPTGQSTTA